MPDLQQELAHLASAERHIISGELRVSRQLMLIERMRCSGHVTKREEFTLQQFQSSLDSFYRYRRDILSTIAKITV